MDGTVHDFYIPSVPCPILGPKAGYSEIFCSFPQLQQGNGEIALKHRSRWSPLIFSKTLIHNNLPNQWYITKLLRKRR